MSHSSVVPMTLLGKRTYVYCSLGGIVGVSAEKEDLGQVLWKSSLWKHSVLAPSPVQVDERRIFLTAGYGGGSMMLGLTNSNGTISAEPIFELPKSKFACAVSRMRSSIKLFSIRMTLVVGPVVV